MSEHTPFKLLIRYAKDGITDELYHVHILC